VALDTNSPGTPSPQEKVVLPRLGAHPLVTLAWPMRQGSVAEALLGEKSSALWISRSAVMRWKWKVLATHLLCLAPLICLVPSSLETWAALVSNFAVLCAMALRLAASCPRHHAAPSAIWSSTLSFRKLMGIGRSWQKLAGADGSWRKLAETGGS
jgi:hypothetical protein